MMKINHYFKSVFPKKNSFKCSHCYVFSQSLKRCVHILVGHHFVTVNFTFSEIIGSVSNIFCLFQGSVFAVCVIFALHIKIQHLFCNLKTASQICLRMFVRKTNLFDNQTKTTLFKRY